MKQLFEDLKETAPCGMLIHYTVDTSTDFVTYTDINGRGNEKKASACDKCSWKSICKPTAKVVRIIPDLKKFYFTFGTSDDFPYCGGYIVIEAPTLKSAARIFREYYPNPMSDTTLNCSDYYTEEQFKKTGMIETKNRGAGCYCIIGPHY